MQISFKKFYPQYFSQTSKIYRKSPKKNVNLRKFPSCKDRPIIGLSSRIHDKKNLQLFSIEKENKFLLVQKAFFF